MLIFVSACEIVDDCLWMCLFNISMLMCECLFSTVCVIVIEHFQVSCEFVLVYL